jgi:hypothetical protein
VRRAAQAGAQHPAENADEQQQQQDRGEGEENVIEIRGVHRQCFDLDRCVVDLAGQCPQ